MLQVSEGTNVPFLRKVIKSVLPSSQAGVILTEKHSKFSELVQVCFAESQA